MDKGDITSMIEAGNRQQRRQAALARSQARQGQTNAVEIAPGRLDRPIYWPRQVITADDLAAGQSYLRDLVRQHNRINHGTGIACGLEVLPAPTAATGQSQVIITRGYALGPDGDEINVPDQQIVLIDCVPSPGDECLDPPTGQAERAVWLAIRYAETPVCPAPHYAAPCDPLPACEHRRVEAGFEIRCLPELPPGTTPACQAWIDELMCHVPPDRLSTLAPLALCPAEDPSPWVVLARLHLDDHQRLTQISYEGRRRIFAVQLLGHALRCLAALAPVGGASDTRFEVYIDRAGEYRWRLLAAGREIIADSGEGFSTRQEVDREIKRIKHSTLGAAIDDKTEITPADQPVDSVWGIGPVYRGRLTAIGIATTGQLASASAAQVAIALDCSAQRATAFVRAAQQLLSG
jgi:uncharacterized protein YegP (UPF0339 family)